MRERLVAKLADAMRTHLAQGGLVLAQSLVSRPPRLGAGWVDSLEEAGRASRAGALRMLAWPLSPAHLPWASIWDTYRLPGATRGCEVGGHGGTCPPLGLCQGPANS